jgi:hypothetical protein
MAARRVCLGESGCAREMKASCSVVLPARTAREKAGKSTDRRNVRSLHNLIIRFEYTNKPLCLPIPPYYLHPAKKFR